MKRKTEALVLITTAFAVLFLLMYLSGNHAPLASEWEPLNLSEEMIYMDDISLTADVPFISSDKPPKSVTVTLKNASPYVIEYLKQCVTVQKTDGHGGWLRLDQGDDSRPGAEIQQILFPDENSTFSVALSRVLPPELLAAGEYRFYLSFTYRTVEDRMEPAYGPVNLSYGYTVAEVIVK